MQYIPLDDDKNTTTYKATKKPSLDYTIDQFILKKTPVSYVKLLYEIKKSLIGMPLTDIELNNEVIKHAEQICIKSNIPFKLMETIQYLSIMKKPSKKMCNCVIL